jgi:hypothetical protein
MFSPSECKLAYRLQRTIAHKGKEDQARKADRCQPSPRNNCAPSLVGRRVRLAVRGAGQRTHDERSHRIIA